MASQLNTLTLVFSSDLAYEPALDLLQAVAGQVSGKDLEWTLDQKTNLPLVQGGRKGMQERWVAEDALIDVNIEADQDPGKKPAFQIRYHLRIGDRLNISLKGANNKPVLPEVKAVLNDLLPEDFDAIHEVFSAKLGEEADQTFSSAIATANIEAALEAGFGAFARHLIDRAMEQSRFTMEETPKHQLWWERLKEWEASLPEDGPTDPDKA